MKLEVGMYVRTYDGINKVIKIDELRGKFYYEFEKPFEVEFLGEDITKSSFNLIDLIEVGDYVNGYKVDCVKIGDEDYNTWFSWENMGSNSVQGEEDIKEILTHEQYEANCYKVGE